MIGSGYINWVHWKLGFRGVFTAAGALADDPQGFFIIPTVNLYTTFAFRLTSVAAGNAQVKLRWGFGPDVTLGGSNGLNFGTLNDSLNTLIARQAWPGSGAALPNADGSPDGILPPVVRVFLTLAAGSTLTYEVRYACLYAP